jgi:hypothetical protein
MYGHATGSSEGGAARFWNAADFDSTFGYWEIKTYEDDLLIRMSDDAITHAFTAGGGVGIGIAAPDSQLHIHHASAGSVASASNTVMTVENNNNSIISILSPAANVGSINFGSPTSNERGVFQYSHANDAFYWNVEASTRMSLYGTGVLAVENGIAFGGSLTDSTTHERFTWSADGAQNVSTSSVVVANPGITSIYGYMGYVNGVNNGNTAGFQDVVYVPGGGSTNAIQVLHSLTSFGSPTARTYAHTAAGDIYLAMASDTYDVNVAMLINTFPG